MIVLFSLFACATTTGGERVGFTVEASAVGPLEFAVDDWQVTLDEAVVALGPVYLWSGEPLVAARTDDDFNYGFLRGEFTEQHAYNLADGDVVLGAASGLAGEVNSAEMWLAPPVTGVDADDTITLRGTAQREGTVVQFLATLTIDDAILDAASGETPQERRKIRGLPLHGEVSDGGVLTIGVDPLHFFTGMNFAQVAEQPVNDAGDHLLPVDTTPFNVLYFQSRQSGAIGPWNLMFRP